VEAAILLAREGRLPVGLIEEVLERARSMIDPQIVAPVLGQAAALCASMGDTDGAAARLAEYREVRQAKGYFTGGSEHISAVLVWLQLSDDPVPEDLLVGPVVAWTRAARLVSVGAPADAAEILSSIGARTIEADVRLHAARLLTESDPAEAVRQLDLATAFWRSVGATACLAQVDDVRRLLRAEAS
jgi:hypothetical protein